jgi:hypothetical protein
MFRRLPVYLACFYYACAHDNDTDNDDADTDTDDDTDHVQLRY